MINRTRYIWERENVSFSAALCRWNIVNARLRSLPSVGLITCCNRQRICSCINIPNYHKISSGIIACWFEIVMFKEMSIINILKLKHRAIGIPWSITISSSSYWSYIKLSEFECLVSNSRGCSNSINNNNLVWEEERLVEMILKWMIVACLEFLANNRAGRYLPYTYCCFFSLAWLIIGSNDDHMIWIRRYVMLCKDRRTRGRGELIIEGFFESSVTCIEKLDCFVGNCWSDCLQKPCSDRNEALVRSDLKSRTTIWTQWYILSISSNSLLIRPWNSSIQQDLWGSVYNVSSILIFEYCIERGWGNIPVPKEELSIRVCVCPAGRNCVRVTAWIDRKWYLHLCVRELSVFTLLGNGWT